MKGKLFKKGDFYIRYNGLAINGDLLEYNEEDDEVIVWLNERIATSYNVNDFNLKFNFKGVDGTLFYKLTDK